MRSENVDTVTTVGISAIVIVVLCVLAGKGDARGSEGERAWFARCSCAIPSGAVLSRNCCSAAGSIGGTWELSSRALFIAV